MPYSAEHLRDLLSLAKMLRRFAENHDGDKNHDLFVSTAMTLEARAMSLASTHQAADLGRDLALHAPVNQLV